MGKREWPRTFEAYVWLIQVLWLTVMALPGDVLASPLFVYHRGLFGGERGWFCILLMISVLMPLSLILRRSLLRVLGLLGKVIWWSFFGTLALLANPVAPGVYFYLLTAVFLMVEMYRVGQQYPHMLASETRRLFHRPRQR